MIYIQGQKKDPTLTTWLIFILAMIQTHLHIERDYTGSGAFYSWTMNLLCFTVSEPKTAQLRYPALPSHVLQQSIVTDGICWTTPDKRSSDDFQCLFGIMSYNV